MVTASSLRRRTLVLVVLAVVGLALVPVTAFARQTLRISTPAVPDDWHTKMLYVFKDELEKTAPGQFDVQIHRLGHAVQAGHRAGRRWPAATWRWR